MAGDGIVHAMLRYLMLIALAACAHAPTTHVDLGGTARDTVLVTYLSGGLPTPPWKNRSERPYGRLVLGDTALAFEAPDGTPLFVLPMRAVKDARTSVEQRGSTALLDARREELLMLETTAPDVLTFRVRRAHTADAAAVKIKAKIPR